MSDHWKPGSPSDWRVIDGYKSSAPARRGVIPIVVSAVLVGFVCGGALSWAGRNSESTHAIAAIEWNAVQAVPTRVPDDEDVEWQRRARTQDGEAQSAPSPHQAGSAVRASFSYCHGGGGANCVVDGDTFWIGGEKVRIAGIDAPETHPPRCADEARLGNAATERLHALLNSGAVTMTNIDRDHDVYGRLLRNVAVDGADVGEAMISAGVAREYGSGRKPWC